MAAHVFLFQGKENATGTQFNTKDEVKQLQKILFWDVSERMGYWKHVDASVLMH